MLPRRTSHPSVLVSAANTSASSGASVSVCLTCNLSLAIIITPPPCVVTLSFLRVTLLKTQRTLWCYTVLFCFVAFYHALCPSCPLIQEATHQQYFRRVVHTVFSFPFHSTSLLDLLVLCGAPSRARPTLLVGVLSFLFRSFCLPCLGSSRCFLSAGSCLPGLCNRL